MIELTYDTERDIDEIFWWYESQSENLGKDFIHRLQEKLKLITHYPLAYPSLTDSIRVARMNRFPYLIYFSWRNNTIVVLAVLHASREPDFIQQTLKGLR